MNEPSNPAVALSPLDQWRLLQKQCAAFIASGFLPDHITKNAKPEVAIARAITIAMKGRELGIPPMQAFSSITVISGKPCLSAELMLALCYQRVAGFKATFVTPPENQHLECTVKMQRQGGEEQSFRFSMDDAQRAGLVRDNSPWRKFPASMLRARVVSAAARAIAPDAIMGCYTPEELGGPTFIEGEIIEPEAAPPASPVIEPKPTPPIVDPLEILRRRMFAEGGKYGYDDRAIKELVLKHFPEVKSRKDMTKLQLETALMVMKSNPKKPKAEGPPVGSPDDIAAAAAAEVPDNQDLCQRCGKDFVQCTCGT